MRPAPARRAPWIIQSPSWPHPTTATSEPGTTAATLNTEPRPVVTPQPSRPSSTSDSVVSTGTTWRASTDIISA
jgi:hypothetical protein